MGIVQGALMFLESEVNVKCREADVKLVESCLASASDEYAKAIKVATGAEKKVELTIDKSAYLPPAPKGSDGGLSCLGGVVLSCQGGKISIDNTIDARLALVMEQDKP